MVNFDYWLGRKYALLQQQADAGTTQAGSGRITANASANAATAAAEVDRQRARLMPGESESNRQLQAAQANLFGEQASIVAPTAAANIANTRANTELTFENAAGVRQENQIFEPVSASGTRRGGSNLRPVSSRRLPGLSLTDPLPTRRAGESEVDYQNRINNA